MLGLLRRQHRGRLVEDQDARAAVQGLQDLQPLAVADRQVADQRPGRRRSPVARRQRPGLLRTCASPRSAARRLGAEHDVLQRGERVHQHEVLVHHADARRSPSREPVSRRLAVHPDLARIGLVKP